MANKKIVDSVRMLTEEFKNDLKDCNYKYEVLSILKRQYDLEILNILGYEPNHILESGIKEQLKQVDYLGNTIGMYAAECGFTATAMLALAVPACRTQLNKNGENIGMIAATNFNDEVALCALMHKECAIQQNKDGMTIGMISAERGLINATRFAVIDKNSKLIEDKRGWNTAIHAAQRNDIEAVILALGDEQIRNRKNEFGYNFMDHVFASEELMRNKIVATLAKKYEVKKPKEQVNETENEKETIKC